MTLTETDSEARRRRRPARDIIDAVVENMRRNLEPLRYSTLAASRYTVYLHPGEYTRLEGIVPIIRDQTIRALTEELDKLNRGSRVQRWFERAVGRVDAEVRSAGSGWQVEIVADLDGDMQEGDLLVDSELLLPVGPELGVGAATRKVTTLHRGAHTTTRENVVTPAPSAAAPPVRATIAYEDDLGHHTYDVAADRLTIGRGGSTHPVDLRIAASPDVSREHARIRRDAATGRFYLTDLSSLGTTLNGRHVPRGYDEVDGGRRDNGAETILPDAARIGLAETVFLDFRTVGR